MSVSGTLELPAKPVESRSTGTCNVPPIACNHICTRMHVCYMSQAELPENKAKTVHPELVKFQLEKKARILGKIGGIPALGPGMASVLPQLPKGQILKATASPAAREIYYSKVEHKDAAQLAGVFQFRKKAESDATPVDWQQEQTTQSVRRASEATAAELRRQEEQEQQLVAGGAVGQELANALRMRQRAVSLSEEDQAAAAASSYRRTAPSSSGSADAAKGLQAATPELAQKLKQRQQQAELARRHSESAAEREGAAVGDGRGGVVSADGASSSSSSGPSLGWSNAKAPFGGELASVLLRRRESKEAAAAAAPIKADSGPGAATISPAADSELQQRLRQRQLMLDSQQQQQQQHREEL
eukprot:GHUV01011251.1.p1 GENE.GHUV01011251.1~~GHUV01011251.1.p1  ORF type:complete len:359 (+),score=183.99 GHUV01011251.1:872-1948(+)